MKGNEYQHIAEIYQHLMISVDYKDWADYISEICVDYNLSPAVVLELASGSGDLAKHLSQGYPKIITTDLSHPMLKQFNNHNTESVCCDMASLPFKNKFQFIISTFDSVNYLTSEEQIIKLFSEIKRVLSDDGIFTFDVSLELNSIRNEEYLNRSGEFNNIKYLQKSVYDKKLKTHYNYFDLELSDGSVIKETHEQKIYDFNFYFEVINECGLFVSECFEAFSFDDADENSERVQFIVKHTGL